MTMMIQAIRLTRKKAALAVILAGAVLAALILLLGSTAVTWVRQSSPVFPATESGWHICGNWAGRSTRNR